MITAAVDLTALGRLLDQAQRTLTPDALADAVELDVADHYSRQRVPVDTGRLKRALTQRPHTPERSVVVLGRTVRVEIRVPYARYQLPRLAPYAPYRLGERLAAQITARLQGRAPASPRVNVSGVR